MSGIAGYYYYNDSDQKSVRADQKTMLMELAVEGSHEIKLCHESQGIGVGGIISHDVSDVSTWEDDDAVIAFHGRLTNRSSLQEMLDKSALEHPVSESRIVKELYGVHGKNTASLLNGKFCFALWDKRKKRFVLATDRYGYGYLYYCNTSGGFFFATEIKAILKVIDRPPLPNMNGICDMHNFNAVFKDDTPFENIFLLPYAGICLVDDNGLKIEKYWEYPGSVDFFKENENELAELAKEKLRKAVGNFIVGSNPAGIMITGGLDSRLLSGLLHKYYPEKEIKLFHIATNSPLELSIVKKISSILDAPLKVFERCHEPDHVAEYLTKQIYLTDGYMGWLDFLPYVMKIGETNRGIGLLNGYLLDTMFKSGFAFFPPNDFDDIHVSTTDYMKRFSFLGDYMADMVFEPGFAEMLKKRKKERIEETNAEFPNARPTETSLRFYCINRGRRNIYCSSKIFGNFVNMILPGIDYDLQDFAMRLPYRLRSNTRFYRKILCEINPELGDVPWDRTGKPLPYGERGQGARLKRYRFLTKYVIQRATRGRIDLLNSWNSFDRRFRRDKKFRDQICAILLDGKTLGRGFFNHEGVKSLIKSQSSGRDHGLIFQTLLNVEFLFRRFIDA